MKEIRNIAFIGSGNVAWHLAPALENAGYIVREVYSPNRDHAKELVKRLYEATIREDLDFSESQADLVIISIKDDAIESVAMEMVVREDTAVVHTSGTQPLSILGYLPTELTGVFYPLQTFSKGKKVDLRKVPFCLETQTDELFDLLKHLAGSISDNVIKMDTTDRKITHLAAVFACNFTNHLLAIAEELMERRGLELKELVPLITETFNKAIEHGPLYSQTGPAVREDHQVMEEHISYLQNEPKLAEIYEILSEHIIKAHREQKEQE